MTLRANPITGSQIITAINTSSNQGNLLDDANALLNTRKPFDLITLQEPTKGKVFEVEDSQLKARLYIHGQEPDKLVLFLSSDNLRVKRQPIDLNDLKGKFAILIDDVSNQIITTGELDYYRQHGLSTRLDYSGDRSQPLRIEISDQDPLAPNPIYTT